MRQWDNDLDLMLYALDHELTEAEAERLALALKQNKTLSITRQKYIAMRKMVAKHQHQTAPDFEAQVLQRWANRKPSRNFQQHLFHLFPRVAAAAVIAFFTLWMLVHFQATKIDMEGLLLVGEISSEEALELLANE